ncbi:hypothetical protein EJB05_28949 [Eragrostis curvula]|uniref:Uncharacterized protein n=1 Tax=Eragrostis curvula TaxID=38414 RepID=A0A5J9URL3_9POAL|nr:hypothetical protein EJB05_28949 [Eragrostis curvula]
MADDHRAHAPSQSSPSRALWPWVVTAAVPRFPREIPPRCRSGHLRDDDEVGGKQEAVVGLLDSGSCLGLDGSSNDKAEGGGAGIRWACDLGWKVWHVQLIVVGKREWCSSCANGFRYIESSFMLEVGLTECHGMPMQFWSQPFSPIEAARTDVATYHVSD